MLIWVSLNNRIGVSKEVNIYLARRFCKLTDTLASVDYYVLDYYLIHACFSLSKCKMPVIDKFMILMIFKAGGCYAVLYVSKHACRSNHFVKRAFSWATKQRSSHGRRVSLQL